MKIRMAIAAVLAMSIGIASADTITLKPEVYIKGPKVLLGDVAVVEGENAEELRAIEIATAALPGSSRRIDASLLQSRIQNAGYDNDSVEMNTTHRVITATTMAIDLTNELLTDDLREHIFASMPWDPEETLIDIVPPTTKTVVAEGDIEITWRANPSYQFLGQGSFRGDVRVDGELSKTVYAKATVQPYAEVLVANQGVARGEVLNASNVHLEKRDLSAIKGGVFFGTDELDGAIAKSSIYPGQIVSAAKVMAPKVVKRNQIVRVQTQLGSLVIQSQAQAMSDGAAGDILRLRNLQSKEEFTGIVGKDGVLTVY